MPLAAADLQDRIRVYAFGKSAHGGAEVAYQPAGQWVAGTVFVGGVADHDSVFDARRGFAHGDGRNDGQLKGFSMRSDANGVAATRSFSRPIRQKATVNLSTGGDTPRAFHPRLTYHTRSVCWVFRPASPSKAFYRAPVCSLSGRLLAEESELDTTKIERRLAFLFPGTDLPVYRFLNYLTLTEP